jgi:hypothetical protein
MQLGSKLHTSHRSNRSRACGATLHRLPGQQTGDVLHQL